MSEFVKPLYWPDGERPPDSDRLGCALLIGLLGSIVAAVATRKWQWILMTVACWWIHMRRYFNKNRSTIKAIADQLASRPYFPTQAWGAPERAQTAEVIAKAITDEIGWPNHHFIPDDPTPILFFASPGDGCEGIAIWFVLRKKFGLGREWTWVDAVTFGTLVDKVIAGATTRADQATA